MQHLPVERFSSWGIHPVDTWQSQMKNIINYKLIKEKYGKLIELEQYIQEKYYVPVEEDKLMAGIYKGLFWGIGDPYSAYLTEEEYNEIMISTTGEYQGIGVTIAPDDKGLINVVSTH